MLEKQQEILGHGFVFKRDYLGAQGRPVNYWQAGHSYANYLRKIDLVYNGADSITLKYFTSYGTIGCNRSLGIRLQDTLEIRRSTTELL